MLSDCIHCWETPCRCGWNYLDWSMSGLIGMRRLFSGVIAVKLELGPDASKEDLFARLKERERLANASSIPPIRDDRRGGPDDQIDDDETVYFIGCGERGLGLYGPVISVQAMLDISPDWKYFGKAPIRIFKCSRRDLREDRPALVPLYHWKFLSGRWDAL